MKQERVPYDAGYKSFFSNTEMVVSLLRDFVPEKLLGKMDLSTLERSFSSYVSDDLRERHDDIIWRVKWKEGGNEDKEENWFYIYLILEFQSSVDPWMALRILGYMTLLWQDLIKDGTVRSRDKLPPIFPIVLYNGKKTWTAARDVADLLIPISGPLAAYQPRQKYFLIDEGRIPEEALTANEGLVALLLRLERVKTQEEMLPIVDALLLRLHDRKYAALRRAFTVWISLVAQQAGIIGEDEALSSLQEVRTMLMERAAQWKGEYIQQGVLIGEARGEARGISIGEARGEARGISIGESKGIRLALFNLLESRFGTLPEAVSSSVNEITDTRKLLSLNRSALQTTSLEAFLEEVKKS